MSLRDQALLDVKGILEATSDFGQAIVLTDPAGATTNLTGLTGDIARAIDADSGAIVKGRTIHVTLRIQSLPAGPRPVAQNDALLKPWRVSFPRVTTGSAPMGKFFPIMVRVPSSKFTNTSVMFR